MRSEMKKTDPAKAKLAAHLMMELVPPLIRKSLVADAQFREEYGFVQHILISFTEAGITFNRTDLLTAIRRVLSGTSVSPDYSRSLKNKKPQSAY